MNYFKPAAEIIHNAGTQGLTDEVLRDGYRTLVLKLMEHIESLTFNWRLTSYQTGRADSVKHSLGFAMDFAPDVPTYLRHNYSRYNNSDPILNQRIILIKDLSTAISDFNLDEKAIELSKAVKLFIDMYLESDHLHIEARPYRVSPNRTRICLFRIWLFDRQGAYPDSRDRHIQAVNGELPFPTLGKIITKQ